MAASKGPNVDTLKEAEDVAQVLSEVLSGGEQQKASALAEKLASFHVPVAVHVSPEAYAKDTIQLKVGLEDAQTVTSPPITMSVTPGMTILELKDKVSSMFGFHPRLQSWVIGRRLARDGETLFRHGVKQDGDQAFLYIRSAQAAQLTRGQHKLDEEKRRLEGIIERMDKHSLEPRGADPGGARGATNPPKPAVPTPKPAAPTPKPKPQVGWSCPMCTYVNRPTRPGCEICSTTRPENYRVPERYEPDKAEVLRIEQEQLADLLYEEAQEDQRQINYLNLLQTDEQSLVPNEEPFDCPVCISTIEPGEGAVLRECLHTFCRDCLKGTITNSTDPEVTCPNVDEDYACDCKLQDREIRAVLSPEELQKFLELRLRIAETRSENSFHCKTPNCQGWCIYEDEVNEFPCPSCNETNCILCKAIHKGMNCKEYQDDLRIRSENDIAAKQTADMLNDMLTKGEAMHCPKCKVIVQKKDGCDWICCVMCKTEMCWVTRQARWGPAGSGDTSGGCKCRVNGPCHPNCQNCH